MDTNTFDKLVAAFQIYKYFAKHPEAVNATNIRAIITATQFLFETEIKHNPDINFKKFCHNLKLAINQAPSDHFEEVYIDELLKQFI